jgi:hypothetical protein
MIHIAHAATGCGVSVEAVGVPVGVAKLDAYDLPRPRRLIVGTDTWMPLNELVQGGGAEPLCEREAHCNAGQVLAHQEPGV